MPIEIVYSIYDRRGKSGTTSVKIADGNNKAAADGFAAAWADAIDNIIGGVIRAATAILGVDISALTNNTATSSSDVEEIASFQFETAIGTPVEVNIPGILETLVTNETGDLNLTATAVANFVALMEDGVTVSSTLVKPCDVGNDDITKLVYARERFRNSGKRKVSG
jgi:hypothetical protein